MLAHPDSELIRRVRGRIFAQASELELLKIKVKKGSQIELPSEVIGMKGIPD